MVLNLKVGLIEIGTAKLIRIKRLHGDILRSRLVTNHTGANEGRLLGSLVGYDMIVIIFSGQ